ncbi:hypothetical protein FD33_GL002383 [Companilactobacillus paralimentarius DSM 13238 = JCM 10415]|uniref:Uncharacterized protein n=1 Tax=Companilactobacillus paralimentarius DSM 13238 = JCM 10415 TaxID=1122151 RepID=A0A0R1PM36_9LACO|nr:hypothetical protein [Companilactobacillus paralimentarius]KAE9565632.1 hypothetical protein ATN96_02445 [Companilactobacillus paralimentarius]KRL31013.1 hypothetical protein FD33_GL002383 [Companilactobacillus paralimentarius DSM 13238 = JCM 10415]MDR4934502.1 hypothetical protein [Companilactobacillus paralimentarius]
MNNLKSKKILASLIEFISYHIFPFIFIFVHNLNNYTIHGFLIIMIAMVALYKEYIITLNPNKYFHLLYSGIYLLLAILSIHSLNKFVIILIFVQLVFLYMLKYLPDNYQNIASLIEDFIVPSFMSIALAFTYMHFISINFVVPLLLINLACVLIDYFEGTKYDYLQLIVFSILSFMLFILNYINIWTTFIIIIFVLIMALLKKYQKFSQPNLFYRVIGNLILII